MADIIIRESAPGRWVVGTPHVRDGSVHVSGRTRWPSSLEAAVRLARKLTSTSDAPEDSEDSEAKRARPSRTKSPRSVDDLSGQSRQVLHHLILRRGLTARQATQIVPPCYSLAQRIHEIRRAFGYDSVETIYRTTDAGARYAVYRWCGPDSVQGELEVA